MAKETGQTIQECVTRNMRRYLEEEEDKQDALLIQQRLDVWEKEGCQGISLEKYADARGINFEE